MSSFPHMVCAAVLQNYGTPYIMLGQYDGEWTLPQVSVLWSEESDENAFLRAIRPFGLSTGTKYISRVGTVPDNPAGSLSYIVTARIHQPLRPGVRVRWLPGERGEKVPKKEGEYRWRFNLPGVGVLAQVVIARHGARLVELSRK